jgi:hypothetical protein
MLRFRELEHSSLYAGLGVQMIDEYESVPSAGFEAPPPGWTTVELDIDDAGVWRPLDPAVVVQRRTASGIVWFPWLEHYRDARDRQPRKYRVRVSAELFTPRYRFDADGVEVTVSPYDDTHPPANIPSGPLKIGLLPAAHYPFPPSVPTLHGVVIDTASVPVANALVSWMDANLQTDSVLTDADGEFCLPMRRAPQHVLIDVSAERPPPPVGGRSGDTVVRLPQDLAAFHTIQIS